jgi:tripartite-type tricarboxylate transporter receptor subunit TctC
MHLLRILAIAFCCGLMPLAANAQSQALYPERPIKIVVPWPSGGTTDRLARMVAARLARDLNQSVIVDNRPGATGSIGSEFVANAPADGYTLLLTTSDAAVRLQQDRKVNPYLDFTQISLLATQPVFLAVGPKMKVKTLKEYIDAARSRRGEVTYSSQGEGSTVNLMMEAFAKTVNITLIHVPYKGAAPALTDLLGGQVDSTLISLQGSVGNFAKGNLVPLAIASSKRSELLPQVPTLIESGVPLQLTLWYGLAAPKGTPPAVVERLNRLAKDAMQSEEIRTQMVSGGTTPIGSTITEMEEFMRSESMRWASVIK